MTKTRKAAAAAEAPAARPATPAPSAKADYRARITGWVAGRRVTEGDILQLTEREARYEQVDRVPAAGADAKGADTE